jgi:hypothetical protein
MKQTRGIPSRHFPFANVCRLSDILLMGTKLLNTRELSKSTAKVLRDLPKTGPRLITRGNEAVGILFPPSPGGIEADIDLLRRFAFARALDTIQRESVLAGSETLGLDDINAEIRAVRAGRKKSSLRK